MSDIRYVCLSDLHLGAENSLLTRLVTAPGSQTYPRADPAKPSEVMVQLVNCLRAVISRNQGAQKPTLVLNGDALELALADFNGAIMVFERFMELTMKPGQELFDRTIYYNPGNHDHHVWETARETQYVEKYLSGTSWGTALDPPWHTTNMMLGEYRPGPLLPARPRAGAEQPTIRQGRPAAILRRISQFSHPEFRRPKVRHHQPWPLCREHLPPHDHHALGAVPGTAGARSHLERYIRKLRLSRLLPVNARPFRRLRHRCRPHLR